MTIDPQVIAAIRPTQALPDADIQGFEERWAAWQVKGRTHERAVRHKLSIAVLIAGIVAVVTFVVFL